VSASRASSLSIRLGDEEADVNVPVGEEPLLYKE